MRADHLRLDRQLAAAAIKQHHKLDGARPAVVKNLVHGRAHGAPGVEDVVDQHQIAAVHIKRQHRGLDRRVDADAAEIVAVEGDVQFAQRFVETQQAAQTLGHPDPAGADADQCRIADTGVVQAFA